LFTADVFFATGGLRFEDSGKRTGNGRAAMPARPWWRLKTGGMVPSNLLLLAHDLDPKTGTHFPGSCAEPGSMTESKPTARARIAPAGLLFLAITSVGWGFNWPVTKYLLSEVPPLTLRGVTGVIGALLLAALALIRREKLKVGEGQWPRLVLAAFLNVTGWMVLMGLALLWLPASEAALIAYTMPVWAAMLAWPVLGERPTLLRTIALVMAFAGLASIL